MVIGMEYLLTNYLRLLCCFCVSMNGYGYAKSIGPPDYSSPWLPMKVYNRGLSRVDFKHGLGETPLLVDVQVKSPEVPNMHYSFPATGGVPRDDDYPEQFGGVTYVYDSKTVIVSSPARSNNYATGYTIYTGEGTYYTGLNQQASTRARVRVRAWKQASLPTADYSQTGIRIEAGSTIDSELYVERSHDLGSYPGLVLVRTLITDGYLAGYMSDAVGSTFLAHSSSKNYSDSRFVIYGYNNESVRVWVNSRTKGALYDGSDGYGVDAIAMTGLLEMYAWTSSSILARGSQWHTIGPNIPGEQLERSFSIGKQNDEIFVTVVSEVSTGNNSGYRFPASGALAYTPHITDSTCSYGGLVYGYSTTDFRFWRPTDTSNGGILCIASYFGGGNNTGVVLEAKVIASFWITTYNSGGSSSGNQKWAPAEPWEPLIETCSQTKLVY